MTKSYFLYPQNEDDLQWMTNSKHCMDRDSEKLEENSEAILSVAPLSPACYGIIIVGFAMLKITESKIKSSSSKFIILWCCISCFVFFTLPGEDRQSNPLHGMISSCKLSLACGTILEHGGSF